MTVKLIETYTVISETDTVNGYHKLRSQRLSEDFLTALNEPRIGFGSWVTRFVNPTELEYERQVEHDFKKVLRRECCSKTYKWQLKVQNRHTRYDTKDYCA